MAGFIALQMSCLRLATSERLTPRLEGLPHVHTTTTWRATPTSLCLIVLVLSCHLLRKRFLILRVFDQISRGTQPTYSLFGDQVQWAVHLLQIVECGKYPRRHQGRNETIGQRTQASSGGHCLQMLLSGIQLQVHILREDRAEPW